MVCVAWGCYTASAITCTLVSIPRQLGSDISDKIEPAMLALVNLYAYVGAVGMGMALGAQSIPGALRQLGIEDKNSALTFVLTAIGFGTRIASCYIVAQVWSIIDFLAPTYIFIWHVFYLLGATGLRAKHRWLDCFCFLWNVVIFATAVAQLTKEIGDDGADLFMEILATYYVVPLFNIFPVSFAMNTLTRLMILSAYISEHPQVSPEDVGLIEVELR